MGFGGTVLVTGAGGFIGHHLVNLLAAAGYRVRGADIRYPEYEESAAHEFWQCDLRNAADCLAVTRGVTEVYSLAANMGGIEFISTNKSTIVRDNTLIDIQMLEAARQNGVSQFLYTSSACVYPVHLQSRPDVGPLREDNAYPADAEDGYGWEKLYIERVCRHYTEGFGLPTRVARLHNVFGPLGSYDGGREKSPAALCRKIALAQDGDEIEVWGDGEQVRSYCYVADCVDGLHRLMRSGWPEPLNLGQTRTVTINQLVDMIAGIANKRIHKRYDPTRPQGVRGRSSDNTAIRRVLDWEPVTSLESGLELTYRWIAAQVADRVTDRVAHDMAIASAPTNGAGHWMTSGDGQGNGKAIDATIQPLD
jgi:GDP-D-mannose 3',5'-epimerase